MAGPLPATVPEARTATRAGVGRPGLLRLQRAVGNRAARTLLAAPATSAAPQAAPATPAAPQAAPATPAAPQAAPAPAAAEQPVVQRRWLIDPFPPKRGYFWEREGEDVVPEPPAWLLAQHLPRIDPAPDPSTYAVWVSDTEKVSRHKRLVYTLEKYQGTTGSSQQSGSKDVYNPFGRFRTTATSSFLPSANLAVKTRDALTEHLARKDKTYKKPTGRALGSGDTPSGYPLAIVVEGGEILSFVEENAYGAVYSLDASTASEATRDPGKDKGLLKGRIGAQADVKMAENFGIDATQLAAWHGTRKEAMDQSAVMSQLSAKEVAADAGFDPDEGSGWEWLHMIAYSMGGMAVHGPQVAGNLVAGTSECNTQMIVVEELIKDTVAQAGGKAALFVAVQMVDPSRHIGGTITYDFELYNKDGEPVAVYHWAFNALSRRKPMVMENRTARYGARTIHPKDQAAATSHQPRSEPTAHRPLAVGPDPIDTVIAKAREAFVQQSPADFVVTLGALRAERGRLPRELFDELGEWLTAQTLPVYLAPLTSLPPAAAARMLRSFLIDNPAPPEYLDALERQVVIPNYGDAGGLRQVIADARRRTPK